MDAEGGVVEELKRKRLQEEAKNDPAGYLARAIRRQGEEGDLFCFDSSALPEVYRALESLFDIVTAEAMTPLQRAALLSELAFEVYHENLFERVDVDSEGDLKQLVQEW